MKNARSRCYAIWANLEADPLRAFQSPPTLATSWLMRWGRLTGLHTPLWSASTAQILPKRDRQCTLRLLCTLKHIVNSSCDWTYSVKCRLHPSLPQGLQPQTRLCREASLWQHSEWCLSAILVQGNYTSLVGAFPPFEALPCRADLPTPVYVFQRVPDRMPHCCRNKLRYYSLLSQPTSRHNNKPTLNRQ